MMIKILKPFKGASISRITQTYHDKHKALDWFPYYKALGIKYLYSYGCPLVAPEKCRIGKLYGNTYTPNDTSGLKNGYGLYMEGLETGYLHQYWHTLPIIPVNTGDIVERGQIVAYCGNSGNVISGDTYVPLEERTTTFMGTHLHQSMHKDGFPVNPLPIMDLETEPSFTVLDELKTFGIVLLKMSSILK